MSPTTNNFKPINEPALRMIARCSGPCVTFQLADFSPGAQSGKRGAHLKSLMQIAAEKLSQLCPPNAAAFIESLKPLLSLRGLERGGGPGLAVFRAPEFDGVYETPGVHADRVCVGRHFDVLPLLTDIFAPREFPILGVSRNCVRLVMYSYGRCRELPLPSKVPRNVEAAGMFDTPDHDLENRSSAGRSVGAKSVVRFGTLTTREASAKYLYNFFRLIDEGLRPFFSNTSVLLMGVHEDLSEYRRAAHNAKFFDTELPGNPEYRPLDDIAREGQIAAHNEFHSASKSAFYEIANASEGERLPDEIQAILHAAASGRVRRLVVAESARITATQADILEGVYPEEDLLNAAVVETLRHSGEVFTIPGSHLPNSTLAAALARY